MKDFIFSSEEQLENKRVQYRTDAVVEDGICNVLEFNGLTDRAPHITEGEGVSDLEKTLINTFHKGTQYKVTDFVAVAEEFNVTLTMMDPNGDNAEVLFEAVEEPVEE